MKAVFMDYTGTIVQEGGKEMQETVMTMCQNSNLHEPKTLLKEWWGIVKRLEAESCGDSYLSDQGFGEQRHTPVG